MSDKADANVAPVAPDMVSYSILVGRSLMSDEALEDRHASFSAYNRRGSKERQSIALR